MTIPGTKIVEDVLKALPTQARLESENRELRARVEELTAKVATLEADLKAAQPTEGIEPDALKVLKVLFEHNHSLVAQTFEDILGMKPGVSTYHCDNLCKLGLAKNTASYGSYEIRPAGRTFLIKGDSFEKAEQGARANAVVGPEFAETPPYFHAKPPRGSSLTFDRR